MEIMKKEEKQLLVRKRVNTLSTAIQEAINKVCEEEKYQVSYAEINAAIIDILKRNSVYEIQELCGQ